MYGKIGGFQLLGLLTTAFGNSWSPQEPQPTVQVQPLKPPYYQQCPSYCRSWQQPQPWQPSQPTQPWQPLQPWQQPQPSQPYPEYNKPPPICASNGVTYTTICELQTDQIFNPTISVVHQGPCQQANNVPQGSRNPTARQDWSSTDKHDDWSKWAQLQPTIYGLQQTTVKPSNAGRSYVSYTDDSNTYPYRPSYSPIADSGALECKGHTRCGK